MAENKATTSKSEAWSLARQQHGAIREFLNQEPTRTDILSFIKEKTGDGDELRILKALLERSTPILNKDISKIYIMAKSTVSTVAKELDGYLGDFSKTIEPLKAKRKSICIPRQEGGTNMGYYFACFDDKTKGYLDESSTIRLFESLWDDFIRDRLHTKFTAEAQNDLSMKLQGRNDYQYLDMEIGIPRQELQMDGLDDSNEFTTSKIYNHNRVWEPFDINSLIKANNLSPYIISVDAGGGKTTFLRHLQVEFLQRTGLIPVFLNASKIEEWKPKDIRQFAEKLADSFDLDISKTRVIDFLMKALEKEIVLLVDGLDQIKAGGGEYECVARRIAELMKKNVIITSRPSAVINLEDENTFTFLRLKPFGINAQKRYFGNNYERAKQISQNATDLVAIPMLAHMVRTLIEEKQDEDITNRTQLYHRFIGYILTKYKHGDAKLSADSRTQIKMNLEKIAYDAISEKEPYLQKVPLDFCYHNDRIPTDRKDVLLTSSGLVNLIIEHSGCEDNDCLFFTHQSFQEYFAAEYAKKDENRIQRVLSEKWNPKWKEVIKFITGIKGQVIIENILSEKDNVIHSKLFLSAELVPETNAAIQLKKEIWNKVEKLTGDSVFSGDAWKCLAYIDHNETKNRLIDMLRSENSDIRLQALWHITNLGHCTDIDLMDAIAQRLEDESSNVIHSAIRLFDQMENELNPEMAEILAVKRKQFCSVLNIDTFNGSPRWKDVRDEITSRISNRVKDIRQEAIMEIVNDLDSNDYLVVREAIWTIGELGDRIDLDTARRVADKLDDYNDVLVCAAIGTLVKMGHRIDRSIIIKIVDKLKVHHEEINILWTTVDALKRLVDKVDEDIIQNIIKINNHSAYDVLKFYYQNGKLE
ncbi:MAG TPA: NACHT domain-containing protein [Anaerohalosphaeraceae bacterium]|nr:NACHT domain-containing protein [Anaerohalosphaeraceae bacterium]